MDMHRFNKFTQHSIVQFTPPLCTELVGEKFVLEMDDGDDFILNFLSEDTLEWSWKEAQAKKEKYECIKGDDFTYLVSYVIEGARPRIDHTFIIDKENMLVTRLLSYIGKNKRWPYLIKTDIEFGSIQQDCVGYKSYPRHGYSSDPIGNTVEWNYGSRMATTHVYPCSDYYRLTFACSRVDSIEDARKEYAFNNMAINLPSSDEPSDWIKIKEGLYLISLTEKNCEKLLGASNGFRSNTLCFLQNYKAGGYVVGRAFGTTTTDEGDIDMHVMIGAYGYFIEEPFEELQQMMIDPNPYLI